MSTHHPLLTDLYQFTMAYAHWKNGTHEREAVFHVFFRTPPFRSGFTIAAGLAPATDYLRDLHFEQSDLAYLRSLALFDEGFLDFLRTLRFTADLDGMPEGTVVFPREPLLRVRGPLLQCQLVETALLNIINFQTLIATKAARIVLAAEGASVLEFGLRRAQGADGALSASRAAFIGGCDATSNVLAGQRFGIPIRGTHAHSWVMSFDSEVQAFAAYASAMPNNALFLVDTYDTLQGVHHAIEAGRRLRKLGAELQGIRLDSGDLAWLSVEARRLLDEAGFPNAKIVATNDLDEEIISSLIDQGAKVDIWGVGTKLVTGFDQPALGGVYKLGAVRDKGKEWKRKIKVSEQMAKTSIPGILQVRRFTSDGAARGDLIYDTLDGAPTSTTIVDPLDSTRRTTLRGTGRDLLVPVCRGGTLVYDVPTLPASRENTQRELALFHPGVKRLKNPHDYPVGLEERLNERRMQLVLAMRQDPTSTGARRPV
jgi:nicotinate phosphoribosyltransferase